MKKLLAIMFLVVPFLMMAQGYPVATTKKTNIYSAPGGTVKLTLPQCDDCNAFIFNVVESRNGWLKIDKKSFSPAEYVIINGESAENTYIIMLEGFDYDCWVKCDDVFTDLYRPGAVGTYDKFYQSPSKKSKCLGSIGPDKILEVKGNWVKVEGVVKGSGKVKTGWMYKPHLDIDICGA